MWCGIGACAAGDGKEEEAEGAEGGGGGVKGGAGSGPRVSSLVRGLYRKGNRTIFRFNGVCGSSVGSDDETTLVGVPTIARPFVVTPAGFFTPFREQCGHPYG
jgi:hypothetical protein